MQGDLWGWRLCLRFPAVGKAVSAEANSISGQLSAISGPCESGKVGRKKHKKRQKSRKRLLCFLRLPGLFAAMTLLEFLQVLTADR
jgi:hypothetical protein